ncbi:MAG: M56 family metallopeptidase [Eubacterium sp.]|nr:M56 family metallopeptidase [Eubacterium sp.]
MGLLEMSISAGVLILFVAVLRGGTFGKLTRRTVMILWMVVLARLLLPGCLPIQNGIAAPVFCLLRRAGILHTDLQKAAGVKAAVSAVPKAASFGTTGMQQSRLFLELAGCVWLAGLVGTGIYFAYLFWKEHRLLAEALPLERMPDSKSIYFCRQILEPYQTASRLAGRSLQKKSIQILVHDRIRSPLVFGVVRQKIVIPKGLLHLDKTQMRHILVHEMIHIRRHDNLWKLLAAAAACIHWFNPAVWLMYLLFARDLELSCDERVLSMYGSQGRQEYAMTLLELAQNQKRMVLFCSGFLENPVKERIVAIMKYKKLTGIGVLCTVMLLAGATSVFATNEQKPNTQQDENAQQDENVQQDENAQDIVYYKITSSENAETEEGESQAPTIEAVDGAEGTESIWVSFSEDVKLHDGEEVVLTCQPASDADSEMEYYYEGQDGKTYAYRLEKGDKSYTLKATGEVIEGTDTEIREQAYNGKGDAAASTEVPESDTEKLPEAAEIQGKEEAYE